jgi:hypothetical protein
MAKRDEHLTEMHFPNLSIQFPTAKEQVAASQAEIARMLSIPDLAERIAKNDADPALKGDGLVSLQINRADGSMHARSESSYTPIPEGIAKKGKTLTQDQVSDVLTLVAIAENLGIDPVLFAQRLAEDAAKREIY